MKRPEYSRKSMRGRNDVWRSVVFRVLASHADTIHRLIFTYQEGFTLREQDKLLAVHNRLRGMASAIESEFSTGEDRKP